MFGRCPYQGSEGIVPSGNHFWENPPNPKRGITLLQKRRGRWHYKKLRLTDQVSQAQAAAILHVSHMQVNRWVRSGDIKDREVLGVSRILVRDLVAFANKKGKDTTYFGRLIDYHRQGG